MSKPIDLQQHICTMLWLSVQGWKNRPDYFDINDLKCLGDLAYIASVHPGKLADALEQWRPLDALELRDGLLNNEPGPEPLWQFLNECDNDLSLFCDLEKYRECREGGSK